MSDTKITETGVRTLWMITRPNSPAYGMTRLDFAYETTVEGRPWLADVDEDHMFEPDEFEVDPDPCGRGFRDADAMAAYLESAGAEKVGWVDADGNLGITRDIQVEASWGGPPGSFDLVPTSFDVISANATPDGTS